MPMAARFEKKGDIKSIESDGKFSRQITVNASPKPGHHFSKLAIDQKPGRFPRAVLARRIMLAP